MIRALWVIFRWLRTMPRLTPKTGRASWVIYDQDDPSLRAAAQRYEARARRGTRTW